MDHPSINQLQTPNDEEEEEVEQAESLVRKAESSKKSVQGLSQEKFFSYCHQQFDQLGNGSMSNHKKMPLMQENFDLPSKNSIPKRRKTEMIDVHHHNGRIVRSKGRKDRHSKVCTSRGPKDRRVRLSPGTAIQFYDVQDRLGYDRPSKAIDWLMKEAKSAIDALNADQSSVNGEFKQMQKHDHLKISENPISGVSDSANGPVPSEFRAWPDEEDSLIYPSNYQDGFLTPLTTPSQIFETNLQRIFANSEYSVMNAALPLQFTGPQVLGPNQIFSQREPLQSSFINYPPTSSEFQGLNFYSEELAFFTAGETVKGKDKIPLVSGKLSFQHKED